MGAITAPPGFPVMTFLDPIILHELTTIRQIINDETWLEAERRGCWVTADDRIVRNNVCAVVLRIGAEMRETSRLNSLITV